MAEALEIGSFVRADADAFEFAEALAASRTAAWRWEIGAPVAEWTSGASRILGLPEIVLRSPELLLEAVHPDDLAVFSRPAAEAFRTGDRVNARLRVRLGDQVKWYEVSGRVVHSLRHGPLYATGTVRDVTDLRDAEEALVDALREADATLKQLGAGVGEWDAWSDTVRVFSGPPGLGIARQAGPELPLSELLSELDDSGRSHLRGGLSRALSAGAVFTAEVKVRGDDRIVRRVLLKGGMAAAPAGRVALASFALD